jgi:hypothetical protein
MASAKHGYTKVVELFAGELRRVHPAASREGRDLRQLEATLDEQLRAYVVKVERLTPTIVDVIVESSVAGTKIRAWAILSAAEF